MSDVCYDNVDPIVLYDIFYESGTRLIGSCLMCVTIMLTL